MTISHLFEIPSHNVLIRSKSAPGCDVWVAPPYKQMFPFAVEAKNRKRLNIKQAFEQAQANTMAGYLPLVISHFYNGKCLDLATLDAIDFFALIALLNEHVPNWHEKFNDVKKRIVKKYPKRSEARFELEEEDSECL